MSLKFIFKKKYGVTVPHYKNTQNSKVTDMPIPNAVTIPMLQHIGEECIPLVKIGDHVLAGQKIGDIDKTFSSPVHSSVSGKVTDISDIFLPGGKEVKAVTIKSDEVQETIPFSLPEFDDISDFPVVLRESGLVGLGGSGFPTHIKLNPENKTKIDTLLINAAECEPFITTDHRECIDNTENIFNGIIEVCKIFEIRRAIIAIEDNKPDAIAHLSNYISKNSNPYCIITLKVLKSLYPKGAEKILILETCGRIVPRGKLPLSVGVIVMNVSSIAFLSQYLKTGIPLLKKNITVDGSAIWQPKNVSVYIGTPIKEVIDFCGGYKQPPGKILMGGPMMGITIYNDSTPVLKQNNAILAFNEEDSALPESSSCIHCGRCLKVCPMNLLPLEIERSILAEDISSLKKLAADNCMECGCCSYTCPASRPLVQSIRIAKNKLKQVK
jgi:electron transport complex, RnfABCDGE type, C subunit